MDGWNGMDGWMGSLLMIIIILFCDKREENKGIQNLAANPSLSVPPPFQLRGDARDRHPQPLRNQGVPVPDLARLRQDAVLVAMVLLRPHSRGC